MNIRVIQSSSNDIKLNSEDVDFYLRQDNWNDFSFKTQYHLFLSGCHSDDGEAVSIGDVKILMKKQTARDGLQIKIGDFDFLSEQFCSLGQSLDYYERIANLNDDLRCYILSSLRDVVIYPENKIGFENEAGWKISLLRYVNEEDDIFVLSPILITREYKKLPSVDLKFKFTTGEMDRAIEFDFDSESYSYNKKLPSRIIVLVGRNGSGKSTLLAKLSRIAFASGSDRNDPVLSQIGKIEPVGLGFPKIVNISYSAFDSFQVPGIYIHEKDQILKDISKNEGRYIFCGIRDICKELQKSGENTIHDNRGRLSDDDIRRDRESFTQLKPVEKLSKEVKLNLELIEKKNKTNLLNGVFEILSKESSFKQLCNPSNGIISFDQVNESFMSLSTGHKFVIHSIVSLVAHTERRSLILFDEPETHLHPPLLAVLMSSIRYLLDKADAFSVVATHSPVVVQESLAKHVNIIKRNGSEILVVTPDIQTYGESLASITSLVFGLSSDITDFHYVLDDVIKHIRSDFFPNSYEKTMSDIEELFEGEISVQARAYIMSKLLQHKD